MLMRSAATLATIAVTILLGAVTADRADAAVPGVGTVITANSPDHTRQIDAAKFAGARWVSMIINWKDYESEPGAYAVAGTESNRRWEELRADVEHAKRRGLRVMVVAKATPRWARSSSEQSAPPDPEHYAAYAAFMGVLAGELGPSVDAYGTWSEPNVEAYWRSPDPRAYARLHILTASAIRRADATATVVLGPVAAAIPGFSEYVRGMYAGGVKGTASVVGLNMYPAAEPEDATPDGRAIYNSLDGMFSFAALLRRLDPGRRVWLTEIGWTTCVDCGNSNVVTKSQQANYLLRTLSYRTRYLRPFVGNVFWYNVRSGENRRRWQSNHGLLEADFRPKPAYLALASASRQLRRPPRVRARQQAGGAVMRLRPLQSRRGEIRGRLVTKRLPSGTTVRIEGWWRGRWRPITQARDVGGSPRFVVEDRGYRALRMRARVRGRWLVVSRNVPNGPALTSARRRAR